MLSRSPAASSLPQPCSFRCKHRTALPSLLLRCLCTTPDRRHTSRSQPRWGHNFSFSVWSTMIYDFHVPTSSTRSVNSSGLSLTVTSGQPSDSFGVRTLDFSCLCSGIQASFTSPSLLLRCLCTTPERRRTSRNQPKEGGIFLLQCG